MAEGRERNTSMMTYDEALLRIAERTNENTKELKKSRLQRRTEFTDLYGVPFNVQGDASNDAEFYISVSPDLIYFLRFQFKLHIHDFKANVSSVSTATGSVDPTTLEVDPYVQSGSSTAVIHQDGVEDNPHTHTITGGGSTLNYGIKKLPTTSDSFTITIDGIDITDYLIEQQDGDWIDGEGLYPTNRIEDETDFYDVMDVATTLYANGDTAEANKLLKPGFKLVQISSDAPFAVTLYLYMKYTTMGR